MSLDTNFNSGLLLCYMDTQSYGDLYYPITYTDVPVIIAMPHMWTQAQANLGVNLGVKNINYFNIQPRVNGYGKSGSEYVCEVIIIGYCSSGVLPILQ